jgi:3-oxoacyl-[acyl-carrier protein] reductase
VSTHALAGRTALVTGANHGIGAATAVALARLGADVGVTYLRLDDDSDLGTPPEYAHQRRATADAVVAEIRAAGTRAFAIEADLSDPETPRHVFDAVEGALGPVSILVNNASGWRLDTFIADAHDRFGRATQLVGPRRLARSSSSTRAQLHSSSPSSRVAAVSVATAGVVSSV